MFTRLLLSGVVTGILLSLAGVVLANGDVEVEIDRLNLERERVAAELNLKEMQALLIKAELELRELRLELRRQEIAMAEEQMELEMREMELRRRRVEFEREMERAKGELEEGRQPVRMRVEVRPPEEGAECGGAVVVEPKEGGEETGGVIVIEPEPGSERPRVTVAWERFPVVGEGDEEASEERRLAGSACHEMAFKKYNEGDYEIAAPLFEAAAFLGYQEIDSLYNAACCYALDGREEEAIERLRSVMEKGFDDIEHMKQDTDLDSLRGNPEFKELLEPKR